MEGNEGSHENDGNIARDPGMSEWSTQQIRRMQTAQKQEKASRAKKMKETTES